MKTKITLCVLLCFGTIKADTSYFTFPDQLTEKFLSHPVYPAIAAVIAFNFLNFVWNKAFSPRKVTHNEFEIYKRTVDQKYKSKIKQFELKSELLEKKLEQNSWKILTIIESIKISLFEFFQTTIKKTETDFLKTVIELNKTLVTQQKLLTKFNELVKSKADAKDIKQALEKIQNNSSNLTELNNKYIKLLNQKNSNLEEIKKTRENLQNQISVISEMSQITSQQMIPQNSNCYVSLTKFNKLNNMFEYFAQRLYKVSPEYNPKYKENKVEVFDVDKNRVLNTFQNYNNLIISDDTSVFSLNNYTPNYQVPVIINQRKIIDGSE